MSALERLVQAKSSAKNYYEARKIEATARAQPPGGQNVNKRILQKCVKQVGEADIGSLARIGFLLGRKLSLIGLILRLIFSATGLA